MSSPAESTYDTLTAKEVEVKTFPENRLTSEAVSAERGLFARSSARAFDNDSLAEHYAPIVNHEGAHRYDPNFEWDPKEEKKVVRKVRLPVPTSSAHLSLD